MASSKKLTEQFFQGKIKDCSPNTGQPVPGLDGLQPNSKRLGTVKLLKRPLPPLSTPSFIPIHHMDCFFCEQKILTTCLSLATVTIACEPVHTKYFCDNVCLWHFLDRKN
jgi:hypothetical protein